MFLFDVDNTLLDNDHVIGDLSKYLAATREVGSQKGPVLLGHFRATADRLGYADYLGALQRYRSEYPHYFGLRPFRVFS